MNPKEVQPRGSGSGTTEHVGGLQGSLAPVAASRPASKGEKKKASALGRAASPGY